MLGIERLIAMDNFVENPEMLVILYHKLKNSFGLDRNDVEHHEESGIPVLAKLFRTPSAVGPS